MEMIVEELNLTTRAWAQIPIRLDPEDGIDEGAVILDAGQQVIYSPRIPQTRGFFRVICIGESAN